MAKKKKLLTPAQYNAIHGAGAAADLAAGHAQLADLQHQLGAVWATVGGPTSETPLSGANVAKKIQLEKQIAALQTTLPHKPKTGLHKIVASIGPKIIQGATLGVVTAGLGSAASTAFSEGGPLSGLGDSFSQLTGGFGAGGPNAASVLGAGGSSVPGIGGTLDDVFGSLSKAGQYAKGAGEALQNFKSAFGSGDDGSDGGGGGGQAAAAPVAVAPKGLPKWAPWAIGGGVVLLLLLVFVAMRKK